MGSQPEEYDYAVVAAALEKKKANSVSVVERLASRLQAAQRTHALDYAACIAAAAHEDENWKQEELGEMALHSMHAPCGIYHPYPLVRCAGDHEHYFAYDTKYSGMRCMQAKARRSLAPCNACSTCSVPQSLPCMQAAVQRSLAPCNACSACSVPKAYYACTLCAHTCAESPDDQFLADDYAITLSCSNTSSEESQLMFTVRSDEMPFGKSHVWLVFVRCTWLAVHCMCVQMMASTT